MTIRQLAKTSVIGLTSHKSRSLLTILGIVIGITSIILVMSLGQGAKSLILGQIQSIGAKTIAVVPGREPTGPADALATFTDSLKERDLTSLEDKNNVPHASVVMPVVFGSSPATYGSEIYQPTIFGTTSYFSTLYKIEPSEGRIFTDDEVQSYADVAVIGSKVETQLFGNMPAVGEKIKIKGKSFRVIGIIGNAGQVSFLNFDEAVFVPYTTAQAYLFGIKYFNRFAIEADSETTVDQTVEDIKITLRNNHNITDPTKDDFFIQTQAEALQTVGTVLSVLTLFLASVAAISLVVGGIGIMNIMLVSVTERTQEIGLRKALGATEKNILSQFLLEAILLTLAGGIIGILLGASLSFLVSLVLSRAYALNWAFVLPISSIVLGLGVSSGIGLVFGIYPARQAAKKNPIDALRYE
ncbi:MAG TPA: ABC transporter permease [Candidatus Paceibacterota bacterium]|nr:ABC transporter permease [Candidatus Paceibacterota bacterium]